MQPCQFCCLRKSLFQLAKEYFREHSGVIGDTYIPTHVLTVLDTPAGEEVIRTMSTLFSTLFWPLQSAVYSFSTENADKGKPGDLKTFGELFTLFTSLSTNCLNYTRVVDGVDVFGNPILPKFHVENGVVSLRFRPPAAAAEHCGPFASYPYKVKEYTKGQMERKLPRDETLGQLLGSQGRRMNPSVSEGIVGLSKYVWNLCANSRTRNDVLRSKIVAMTTTLQPREELYSAKLRLLLIACIRSLQSGRDRNEEESRKRLREIEDRSEVVGQARERKRQRLARLALVEMVTDEEKLGKLSKLALIDQACIRGLKNCQGLKKEALVNLCLRNTERTVYAPVAGDEFNALRDGEVPPDLLHLIEDDDNTED